jgi:hypothetical protein
MKMTAQEAANGKLVGKGKQAANKGAGPKKAEQGRIKPMRITKAVRGTTTNTLDGKQHPSKNGLAALTISTPPGTKDGTPGKASDGDHDLLLDAVVRRRVNWTPPKNTIPTINLSMTPGDRLEESPMGEHPRRSFKDLLSSFVNEQGGQSNATAIPVRLPAGPRKRQRTEVSSAISLWHARLIGLRSSWTHIQS